MAAKDNLTKSVNVNVTPREIDFVTRFARNWEALREVLGIMRPIRKQPGAVLKSKYATVALQPGNVAEGDEIPFSQATVGEKFYAEMDIEKYAKSVSIENIKDHGYDAAVGMTDDAFLFELQSMVTARFYDYLNSGELTNIQTSFQAALAMAKGLVVNKWKKMHLNATEIVGFANVLDVYEYLGSANITVQTAFGFQYIKDFMGYGTIFLLSDDEIARGKVIATPVENIVLYYVDPSTSDFARAGLSYVVEGNTNLIGFHTEGDYTRATSNCFAIMGMVLFAEYIDGIAVVDVEASGSLGSITVASEAGTAEGDSKVTITYTAGAGEKLYYKDSENAITPTYKDVVDLTGWTAIEPEAAGNQIADLTSGNKISVIAVNGSGQAVAAGNATIVVNS